MVDASRVGEKKEQPDPFEAIHALDRQTQFAVGYALADMLYRLIEMAGTDPELVIHLPDTLPDGPADTTSNSPFLRLVPSAPPSGRY